MPLPLHNLQNPLRVDAAGVARVGQTRVALETVVRRFLAGDTPEEIADAYALDLPDAYAAVTYFLQHRAEVDAYLRASEDDEARIARLIEERSHPAALREKLLARAAVKNRAG